MAKINVQFHGLPQEILKFAEDCTKEHKLISVAIVFFPNFKAQIFNQLNLLRENQEINRICLCNSDPDLSANSAFEFSRKNPDCLSITIGKYDEDGLVESILSAQTENKAVIKLWRKIVAKLDEFTSEGAWVINPKKNSKEFYQKHRYTDAAKKIADNGVIMKPVAGWNHFILGSGN